VGTNIRPRFAVESYNVTCMGKEGFTRTTKHGGWKSSAGNGIGRQTQGGKKKTQQRNPERGEARDWNDPLLEKLREKGDTKAKILRPFLTPPKKRE